MIYGTAIPDRDLTISGIGVPKDKDSGLRSSQTPLAPRIIRSLANAMWVIR
jgi:hypothetical protein